MICELTFSIKGEEKTLKKKIGPLHAGVSMNSDDPFIRQEVDAMIKEFNAPIDDVVVICKMTL